MKFAINFFQLSEKLGYTADIILDYENEVRDLVELWVNQKFVEIYELDSEQKWGRIKDTAKSGYSSVPYYLGMFHSRVLPHYFDPLLLLSFDDDILYIRMFTDHNDLFGEINKKNDFKFLKSLKQKIAKMLGEEYK